MVRILVQMRWGYGSSAKYGVIVHGLWYAQGSAKEKGLEFESKIRRHSRYGGDMIRVVQKRSG